MADVDPDLEAAAEALYADQCERSEYVQAPYENCRSSLIPKAAAVLAALRAAGWARYEYDITPATDLQRVIAWLEEEIERDFNEVPDNKLGGQKAFGLVRNRLQALTLRPWADPAPVGEMGAAQAEPMKRLCYACGEPVECTACSACGYSGDQFRMTPIDVAAPMSHAVLGDETSTSGGVGIPSAAVPEQPSLAAVVAGWRLRVEQLDVPQPTERLQQTVDNTRRLLTECAGEIEAARGVSDSEAGR